MTTALSGAASSISSTSRTVRKTKTPFLSRPSIGGIDDEEPVAKTSRS